MSYLAGLRAAVSGRRNEQCLVLFLGSTIGNLVPEAAEAFCGDIRGCLNSGDGFLLGCDIGKALPSMLLAYDDPLGITAAFNLNLLARINRELGGNFDLSGFRHEARYNSEHRRVEMHLRSQKAQTVTVRAADFEVTLKEGETIWTECSYKFRPTDIISMAARSGFRPVEQWLDQEWPFAESLWKV